MNKLFVILLSLAVVSVSFAGPKDISKLETSLRSQVSEGKVSLEEAVKQLQKQIGVERKQRLQQLEALKDLKKSLEKSEDFEEDEKKEIEKDLNSAILLCEEAEAQIQKGEQLLLIGFVQKCMMDLVDSQ